MTFYDDEPITCEACGELIYAGESYLEYNGQKCCDDNLCLGQLARIDVEEKLVKTAYNHKEEYGDEVFDSNR